MIQAIYDDMWRTFCSSLDKEQYEIDLNIANENDSRRGITALAYLEPNNENVAHEIEFFLAQLRQMEPEQYYHPTNELHVTLLSIITCIAGFQLTDIDPVKYVDVFYHAFSGIDKIEIEFKGVTASSSCVVIQGFPIGSNLHLLRDNLRKHFKASGLHTSIDGRYKIETAHVSALRFCTPVKDTNMLKALCEKYRKHYFGTITFTNFELVYNNWYLNSSITKQLAVKKGS